MPGVAKTASLLALDALRAIVAEGNVREAVRADKVCGAMPKLYAEPANEAELSRVLEYANLAEMLVAPRGGGTKLEWGTALSAVDLIVSTARLNSIIEYAPSDMTVTVGAGITLARLQRTLSSRRQRLALDPLWPESATVGGVIATNDSGALRLRYGAIRDLIIGITVVLADGTIATSGGRVVKNVAGYDLPKLMSGALGSLGIITRAVFRLHPLPEVSQTQTFSFPECGMANEFMLAVANSTTVPSGLQMRTGKDGSAGVDVRVEGCAVGTAAQAETVRLLAGKANPLKPSGDPWQAREQLWNTGDSAAILKLSVLPTQLASTPEFVRKALRGAVDWELLMHSTGLAWLSVDGADYAGIAAFIASLRSFVAPTGGTVIVLKAAPPLRQMVDVWGDAGGALPLMQRIKWQFDPRRTLNRGRFVGGI